MNRNMVKFIIVSCLFGISLIAGAKPTYYRIDLKEFENKFAQKEAQVLKQLKNVKVLLVPGLATDLTEKAGEITGYLDLTREKGFLAPFYQQKIWLKSRGVDFEVVNINRVGGCQENAKVISKAIEDSDKPVVLITQSKGGVDALHALVKNKKLHSKVVRWLAYQPPVLGTPLADLVNEYKLLSLPTDGLINLLEGTPFTYKDMTTTYRENYFQLYENDILEITKKIPTTILVTFEEERDLSTYLTTAPEKNPFLSPLVKVIHLETRETNDGIALLRGTCLPGAKCFIKGGIDHFAAVMDTYPFKGITPTERLRLMQFLLYYTL